MVRCCAPLRSDTPLITSWGAGPGRPPPGDGGSRRGRAGDSWPVRSGQLRALRRAAGGLVTLAAVAYLVRIGDVGVLRASADAIRQHPADLALALLSYAAAFGLRGVGWRRVLPTLPSGQAWAALHVSLLGNHVLPLRLGEVLRVTSVVRRTPIGLPAAVASSLTLRAADLLAVLALAAVAAPRLLGVLAGRWLLAVAVVVMAVGAIGVRQLHRLRARTDVALGLPGPVVAVTALAAWLLESVVMWQAARWVGVDLSAAEAVAVTAVTIAAQTVAVTPGGIGSYEAAATAALTVLGSASGPALTVAITAHAVKTAYALVVGAVALFLPGPGYWGHLRLPPRRRARPPGEPVSRTDPVVVFLPAHNEEETVGDVVRRVPPTVAEHPVVVLVIDDGSSDDTARRAAVAGAVVISVTPNRGLGAAVRRGLAEASALSPAVVVYLDADGEYAPEDIAGLVAPIRDGTADYVIGSRFAGRIDVMRPHRRLGNRLLTRWLRVVSRHPVTDGQSGMRAFSRVAARQAEVIHDYNYAQVLTLDLLAKGFGYAEVPIRYSFRNSGKSFIRPGSYLRRVVPAVHRQVQRSWAEPSSSVLDDVPSEALTRR
ncbi:MAG TPA: lysylphosphatidylglycerol synthase domain-containing protein [Mycobacteriales bacterium]|nr:lysylphosphatidylglycerol synthase domain-containing protein [Mycobacteriales bacterium]